MKYLFLSLILVGCATAPRTPENCFSQLRAALVYPDTATELEKNYADVGVLVFCREADNDPDLAFKRLKAEVEEPPTPIYHIYNGAKDHRY